MKRIYIAGGGGMLGEAFYQVFKSEFELRITDIDINEDWIHFLDFRDFDSYRNDILSFKPDYLFHLGAHTSLEYCEEHEEDCFRTNTASVKYAVEISNQLNIPLLFISTAGIFDGRKNIYDEKDTPNPLSNYAQSKYNAEKYIRENKLEHLICRAGWMMGGGQKKDKKFVGKILKQIKDGKQILNIVNDKFGTPTYTHDFACNVKLILEKRKWGLYNLVCEGETSRLEVAKEIICLLNMEHKIIVKEVGSDFFQKEYFAPRPFSERLINAKLNKLGLNTMRNWKTCLKEYLERYV